MVFKIEGKVALITGSASGIGLQFAKELLRNGLRGVTIVDINSEVGHQALEEIKQEFGPNKAIFVPADVSIKDQLEDAFKETIKHFKNLDILINNAGIFNDSIWEREIAINLNGTINGMLLGLENYIPKHKSSSEGVIVNISSIAGVQGFSSIPIYTATKFGIHGMTKAWGATGHYERTKVKVLALCPGITDTPLVKQASGRNLGKPYEKILRESQFPPTQTPLQCAKAMVKVIQNGTSGTVWIAEGGEEPYEYIMPERESIKKSLL